MAAETVDQTILLARMLRRIDRMVEDAKEVEKDRDELRRLSQRTDNRREVAR